MEKKKILKLGILILAMILIATLGIFLNREKDVQEVVVEPLNTKVNLNQVFEEIVQLEEAQLWENEEIIDENEIDFGKYNLLERKAIVNTTDDCVSEVWMVKLGDYDQQEDIMRIFGNRIQKLRSAFEENGEVLNVINNAIIKQEDGIVIMIVSEKLDVIEKSIAESMN